MRETPAAAFVDGNAGLGAVVGQFSMQLACDKAIIYKTRHIVAASCEVLCAGKGDWGGLGDRQEQQSLWDRRPLHGNGRETRCGSSDCMSIQSSSVSHTEGWWPCVIYGLTKMNSTHGY